VDYRYKKSQIFKKKLSVPNEVLNRVYNNQSTIHDFIEYDLEGKIPVSCLEYTQRKIVEKFGIQKAKDLDWDLINSDYRITTDKVLELDANTENINSLLYKEIVDTIAPNRYTTMMQLAYPDRLLIEENVPEELRNTFNSKKLSLNEVIENWQYLKEKNLTFHLLYDYSYYNITDDIFKQFMSEYSDLLIFLNSEERMYKLISKIYTNENIDDRKKVVADFINEILKESVLTNEQYATAFKYVSIGDYLTQKTSKYNAEEFIKEVNKTNQNPSDFILNLSIPFSVILEYPVQSFINIYGLNNILDFDKECGNFFTKNNYEMLRLISPMYLDYGGNINDKERTIYTIQNYDEAGNYLDRSSYTKEEFYEAIRRMIMYGPTDWNYKDKAPDYSSITGPFREKNQDLYISENAPEELKKAFYTKGITPKLLGENPNWMPFLRDKNFAACFYYHEITVNYQKEGKEICKYPHAYQYLLDKCGFDIASEIILNYSNVLKEVFTIYDHSINSSHIKRIEFYDFDDVEGIKSRIEEGLAELISKTDFKYSHNLPKAFKEYYPQLFLSDEAPDELKNKYYNRELDAKFISDNPEYIKFLTNLDIRTIFKYIPVKVETIRSNDTQFRNPIESPWSLVNYIREQFKNDTGLQVFLSYGKYFDIINENNGFENFVFEYEISQSEILTKLEDLIHSNILNGLLVYDENLPERFKQKYPTLFLPQDTPMEIKNKFYNRLFTLKEFTDNPDLLKYFDNTNVACAFDKSFSWIMGLFNDKSSNPNIIKILNAYSKVDDVSLQKVFREYVLNNMESINVDKIDVIADVLFKLSFSNSSEMLTFRSELASQLLLTNDPLSSLNKIEDIFLRNNIPVVGKIFSVFQILHPNCSGFDFSDESSVSPILKSKGSTGKEVIIFSDLLKATLGSNNRSIISYLNNIEKGNQLLLQMNSGNISFDVLDNKNKEILSVFVAHLNTLYNNTIAGKKDGNRRVLSNDIKQDINELIQLFSANGNLVYDLPDRIIKMFCHFAGFDTFEQLKNYTNQKIKLADTRNRESSSLRFKLEYGDFVKGIDDIKYLANIFQNGSVAREFLGSSAGSDWTPLDTDLSRILDVGENIADILGKTEAKEYGSIWFVLKNDDRFTVTRKSPKETDQTIDTTPNSNKLEVFYTGAIGNTHYGIRTGFASSEIDYIITSNYDSRIGLEIAKNGFYIPVVDVNGELKFSPQEYDELRSKMTGLTQYYGGDYTFDNSLSSSEINELSKQIYDNESDIANKHNAINTVLSNAIANVNLRLKTVVDGDITEGSIELIDTGSTGRGTNMPGKGDFDFIMRLDKKIITNSEKLKEIKDTLLKALGRNGSSKITRDGDFRLKQVIIERLDEPVDIDITFVEKTDKLTYSTDMSLRDRLDTIKKQAPEQYPLIISNILLAKQFLESAGVYKSEHSETPQGGLGGVGIENWILQNGGSFVSAATEFLKASNDKSFEEFKKSYHIWDFGENHLANKRGLYPHDNFVENNMSEAGYQKMNEVLTKYLIELQNQQTTKKQR